MIVLQPFAGIPIGQSQEPPHKPKLAKEYACPNTRGDSATKLNDNEINKKSPVPNKRYSIILP
jgi:hypothetical protein